MRKWERGTAPVRRESAIRTIMRNILYSLKSIHKILKEAKPSKVCLVTSPQLARKLAWAVRVINIPKSRIILVSDGEKAKTWPELEILLRKFSNLNLDRKSIVIALGGGTVGDLVGFATAIYLRGIKYIQIPTTLLAQVDSAHGGKTGIDFLGYKNQIGSFYLPVVTIVDSRFIKSLSQEQIIDGLGEIIKAGLIKDPMILSLLGRYTVDSLINSRDLLKIIKKSIVVKNYFTKRDFKDNNLRSILNAGHTFGHTIELKYGISHGRAVISGLIHELAFTEARGLSSLFVRERLLDLLEHLGIKIDIRMKADWKTIIHDKKITGQTIDFPVIKKEGKARIIKLDLKVLKSML